MSKLRLGFLEGSIRRQLGDEMRQHSWEAVAILEALMALEFPSLQAVMPWLSSVSDRDGVVLTLLNSAAEMESTIAFPKRVYSLLVKALEVLVLLMMICSEPFLQNPNFP
jgi:hypothetical protein